MAWLLRMLVVVAILLFAVKFTGFLGTKPTAKQQVIDRSNQIRSGITKDLDAYQDKLDKALEQSGGSQ